MISETAKKLIGRLYGALVLEDVISHKNRRMFLNFFGFISVLIFAVMFLSDIPSYTRVKGAFLICLSFYLILLMLESYFYSFYERSHEKNSLVPFEIGEILFYSEGADLVKGLLFSDLGYKTMKRLGFDESEIKNFLVSGGESANMESLAAGPTGIDEYSEIIASEEKFAELLFKKGLKMEEFKGAFGWVIEEERRIIESERFWSKEHLSRIPVIGKNWSYGETYVLERYGRDITDEVSSFLPSYEAMHDPDVLRLESILCKQKGANCIITSDDEASRMDTVLMLAEKIKQKVSFSPLVHKRVYVLNTNLIIEHSSDKISFERYFTDALYQAMNATNIILVIPFFSSFVKSAKNIGSDVVSIISPFLLSPTLNIIILDSRSEFHAHMEQNETLMEYFEILKIGSKSGSAALSALKIEAEKIERETGLFITYPALVAISDGSKRYFDSFDYAEKAKDILIEAVPYCLARGIKILSPKEVNILLESRTGVPTGEIKEEEREELKNLESLLHEKIIGQDEAIKAISKAMRRSRTGVRNPDRPIGSFLFLGPTGVGKTETTKALAEIFFHSEKSMSRLDMSEFKNTDALQRLIGSFDTEKPGILANLLREKPYGVLLLDEFEKTNGDVLNLFLQILDEGFFSDAEGKKVNARNNIIIATSNAGSEYIWDAVKKGNDLAKQKDEIIDAIIKEGFFKPELLNRFDGVILFDPLSKKDLEKIALLMMEKLSKRMIEKGIKIEVNNDVISYLVLKGSDPKFGARPMNRAIQEEVEELFAEGMIEGNIKKGSKVTFEVEDGSVLKIKAS